MYSNAMNQIGNITFLGEADNPVQKLRVEATSTDAGFISYEWTYVDTLDQNNYLTGTHYTLEGVDEYVPIAETEIEEIPHKMYYKRNGSGDNISYEPTSFRVEEGLQLYEKTHVVNISNHMEGKKQGSTETDVIANTVGKYYATATNTVGGNEATTSSLTLVFPGPEILDYTEEGNLPNNSYLNNGGEGSISVQVEVDERGAKPTFEWQYGTSNVGPFAALTDANFSQTDLDKWSINEAGNELTINNKPGFYRVLATSTRNYATIDKMSDITKVTLPLGAPTITSPLADTAISSLYGA